MAADDAAFRSSEEDIKALRDAQPSWVKQGGIRGTQHEPPPRKLEFKSSTIDRTPPQAQWPDTPSTGGDSTSQNSPSANFNFALSDASVGFTAKVLIRDGKVNGMLPAGMGGDNYTLGTADGNDIYLIITYDPTLFTITSVSAVSGVMPTSTLGTLYHRLGTISVTVSTSAASVSARNTWCGDVNIAFAVGTMNGAPAVIPLARFSDWVATM